jgi:hypothetical protein
MNQKVKKLRQSLVAVIILTAVAGFTSCEKFRILPQPVDPNAIWSFKTDIQPVFNEKCVGCHGGTRAPNLSAGKSYDALIQGGYVDAPAETSKLYSKMNSSSHDSRSSDSEKLKVLYWIEQGAKNN